MCVNTEGKRRTWRKVQLVVDKTTKGIVGLEVTTANWGDSEILPGLLDQTDRDVSQVPADGAYDRHGCHAAIAERDARPPSSGYATARSHG